MALISPILDDRSYDQLREELLRRIPVYTPEWTNHNESDPGIALLDLFAYLGESVLYRFNQIPDTTKIEFLRLLGVQPRPAVPASVLLAATTDVPAGVPIDRGTPVAAGAIPFQTVGATQVWPLECVGVGKVGAPDDATVAGRDQRLDAKARVGLDPGAAADFYLTAQLPTDPTAAGASAIDVSATLDRSLWIAVLRKPATDLRVLLDRSLFLGVAFDETIPRPFALQPTMDQFRSDGLDQTLPPMLWQLWNGPSLPGQPRFVPLTVGDDTTRSLTTTGVVEILLPRTLPIFEPTDRTPGDENNPPPLTDEEQAKDIIAWLRVSRPESTSYPNDAIHRVRWVGLNATTAAQSRSTLAPELLGTGSGDGGQTYPLTKSPVLPGTTRLQVEEPDGWHDWAEVPTFVDSGADDRHYTVDYAAGAVSFGGDRVPQIGERIRTLSYRYGGGAQGNVAAGAVAGISGVGGVKIANPLPATGGTDAASLTEALEAIPAEVHRHDRAVIADDFRTLAGEVVGVRRAEALPLLHPDHPADDTPGVVTVVIFPTEDLLAPDAPVPDTGLLRRVAKYLDVRRLITTELYVIPPTYRPIAVSIGLQVRPGYQVDAVRRWAELIVQQYLSPVPPLGPDGNGWPLGRTVRRAELEAVAVQVEGVEYSTGLILSVPSSGNNRYAVETEITLDRWEVPQLVELVVVSGPPLDPGEAYRPSPPARVLVPIPPDVC